MKSIKIILSVLFLISLSNILFSQELHKVPITSAENKFIEQIYKINIHYDNGRVCIKWVISSEDGNGIYAIERSKDGENFVETGSRFIGNKAISTCPSLTYLWFDEAPITGISYYRFSKVDKNKNIPMTENIPVICPSSSMVIVSPK